MGLTIERYFTKEGVHPYETVKWTKRIAEIKGSNFRQEDVEFPEQWSNTAVNIVSQKFFAGRLGTPERESSLKQCIDRIVNTITAEGIKKGYLETNQDAYIFSDELKYMLIHQYYSFNSPVWFNIGNKNNRQQASACFILSVEDSMEAIADNVMTEMMIFRSGSGAGSNRSALRSSKEYISGGGKASGPCSFMKIYDSAAGVTKSGGKSRRAAKMEILDLDHGDIKKFITMKGIEEKKALALIQAGFNSRFDDPDGAYGSVYFQNSNMSVSGRNAFMQAVEKDEDWALLERYATDSIKSIGNWDKVTSQGKFITASGGNEWYVYKPSGFYKVIEWVKARDLFRLTAEEAWKSGDPGFQFRDTINEWNTCANDEEIKGSNPCSEYLWFDDTSCNLGSLNLIKFFINKKLLTDAFDQAVQLAIMAQDILVDYAEYPTEKIAKKTREYRTLGLGYSNVGALLMSMGVAYDSAEAGDIMGATTAYMQARAYWTSHMLAETLGSFERYTANNDVMSDVMDKHFKAACLRMNADNSQYKLYEEASKLFDMLRKVVGFRNAQVTCLAPTGTIAFLMDCDTTGIEPAAGLIIYKKLVGGGELKLTLNCVSEGLRQLGYTVEATKAIEDYISENGIVTGAPALDENHYGVFATAFGMDNIIRPEAHLNMMAAVQPFLSGGISKTVNLPNSATVEDIEKIYMDAWKMGLKAVALYRDGSKSSQPLNVKSETKTETAVVPVNNAPIPARKHMPETRQSVTHKFSIAGVEGYLTAGLYEDGTPGEVFVRISKEGSTISGLMDSWATMLSISLQHGVPLEELVDKFSNTKFEPAGITQYKHIRFTTSLIDYISKWLKINFIDRKDVQVEGIIKGHMKLEVEVEETPAPKKDKLTITLDGPPCSECGGLTYKNGTCYVCNDCGTTTGCS